MRLLLACIALVLLTGATLPKPFETKRVDDGQIVTEKTLKSDVVLIDFFAVWCDACKKELVALVEKTSPDVSLRRIWVSLDKDIADTRKWLDTLSAATREEILIDLYHDPEFKMAEAFGIEQLPFTVVLNKKNEIVFSSSKGIADLEAILKAMNTLRGK